MAEEFDPYQQWLGIAKHEQPANYYRLLGVGELMEDIDAIGNAADRQMNFVRTFQLGKHGHLSQQILRELAQAKLCLLNPERKAEYDAGLREARRPPAAAPAQPAPPPVVAAPPAPAAAMIEPVVDEMASPSSRNKAYSPRTTAQSGLPPWVWIAVAGLMTLEHGKTT